MTGVVAVLVLTVTVGVVVLWRRSAGVQDSVCRISAAGRVICLYTHPGGVSVEWSNEHWDAEFPPTQAYFTAQGNLQECRRAGPGWHADAAGYARASVRLAVDAKFTTWSGGKKRSKTLPAGTEISLPSAHWLPPAHWRWGFGRGREIRFTPTAVAEEGVYRVTSVHAPFAAFTFGGVAALAAPAWAVVRRRRRRTRNLCLRCGYDLRGSPGRCPECWVVAA